jgi:hypothetical protein
MSIHLCQPKLSINCFICGSPYPTPQYCTQCGADISPRHMCRPQPSLHICHPNYSFRACHLCGSPMPPPHFCTACGTDISERHQCRTSEPPFFTYRPTINMHLCQPTFRFSVCTLCGESLSPPSYCPHCGMDISSAHVCTPKLTMHMCHPLHYSQRCVICGETLPLPFYCSQCGQNIAEPHVCRISLSGMF